MNPIRIFLVDDHAVLLEGLVAALGMFSSVKVVGTAMSAEEGLVKIREHRDAIDVVVTDHSMSGMDGVAMCEILKRDGAVPRVVLLTMHAVPEVAFRAIRKGVDRVVPKSMSIDKVVENIIAVFEQTDGPTIASGSVEAVTAENPGLTKTELLILKMIAIDELTTREIAEKLFRSAHTVERHRKSIMGCLLYTSDAADE